VKEVPWQDRQLYAPEQLPVKEDFKGNPITVGKGNRKVTSIEDRWRIDDEWWRQEPISRMYYSVVLDNGQNLTIYKDLINNHWYKQQA
jgi:hypothetical protein